MCGAVHLFCALEKQWLTVEFDQKFKVNHEVQQLGARFLIVTELPRTLQPRPSPQNLRPQ